jgi:hypothetical protein
MGERLVPPRLLTQCRLKLIAAAILVFRASTFVQAAPAVTVGLQWPWLLMNVIDYNGEGCWSRTEILARYAR